MDAIVSNDLFSEFALDSAANFELLEPGATVPAPDFFEQYPVHWGEGRPVSCTGMMLASVFIFRGQSRKVIASAHKKRRALGLKAGRGRKAACLTIAAGPRSI